MAPKFWGVELEGENPNYVIPETGELIRISQIALGDKSFESAKSVTVYIRYDGEKSPIARLSTDTPQVSVDFVLESNFVLLHNWKEGSVYVSGYTVNEEVPDGKVAATEPDSSSKADKSDESDSDDSDYEDVVNEVDDDLDDDQFYDMSEDESPEKVESPKNRQGSLKPLRNQMVRKGVLSQQLPAASFAIPESSAQFTCKFCSRTFKFEKGLEDHLKAKHDTK